MATGKRTARRDRGTGSLFQRASDGLWMAYLELPPDPKTGKRRRKVVSSKRKQTAAQKLAALRRELEARGNLPTENTKVSEWANAWLERLDVKPRTTEAYRSNLDRLILPAIGRVPLAKLTAGHVRQMLADITDRGLSPTTALGAHRVLRKMLADAVREDVVPTNVAAKITPPRAAHVERSMLTLEQANAVLAHEPDPMWRLRWAIALFNGARQGEVLGIRPEHVDPKTGLIELAWQVQRLTWDHGCGGTCGSARGGNCPQRTMNIKPNIEARQVEGGIWMTRPKTMTSWRRIMLMPEDRALLAQVMVDSPGEFLFHENGHVINPRDDWARWKQALERAGAPDVTLHSARNSAATLLREAGVDEQMRMAILGHTSAAMTRHYTRVEVESIQKAMEMVAQIAGRSTAQIEG